MDILQEVGWDHGTKEATEVRLFRRRGLGVAVLALVARIVTTESTVALQSVVPLRLLDRQVDQLRKYAVWNAVAVARVLHAGPGLHTGCTVVTCTAWSHHS